jgi:ferredoxin
LLDHVSRPPHPPAGHAGDGPLVLFGRSNLSVRWDPSFGSLLDLAEACDVPAGFGCRTGVCHACESGLVSGEVDYQYDPLEPPPPGQVLLCCTQPRGDLALDL